MSFELLAGGGSFLYLREISRLCSVLPLRTRTAAVYTLQAWSRCTSTADMCRLAVSLNSLTRGLNPFSVAVPFCRQTTLIKGVLSPKRDCSSKRVVNQCRHH